MFFADSRIIRRGSLATELIDEARATMICYYHQELSSAVHRCLFSFNSLIAMPFTA